MSREPLSFHCIAPFYNRELQGAFTDRDRKQRYATHESQSLALHFRAADISKLSSFDSSASGVTSKPASRDHLKTGQL